MRREFPSDEYMTKLKRCSFSNDVGWNRYAWEEAYGDRDYINRIFHRINPIKMFGTQEFDEQMFTAATREYINISETQADEEFLMRDPTHHAFVRGIEEAFLFDCISPHGIYRTEGLVCAMSPRSFGMDQRHSDGSPRVVDMRRFDIEFFVQHGNPYKWIKGSVNISTLQGDLILDLTGFQVDIEQIPGIKIINSVFIPYKGDVIEFNPFALTGLEL